MDITPYPTIDEIINKSERAFYAFKRFINIPSKFNTNFYYYRFNVYRTCYSNAIHNFILKNPKLNRSQKFNFFISGCYNNSSVNYKNKFVINKILNFCKLKINDKINRIDNVVYYKKISKKRIEKFLFYCSFFKLKIPLFIKNRILTKFKKDITDTNIRFWNLKHGYYRPLIKNFLLFKFGFQSITEFKLNDKKYLKKFENLLNLKFYFDNLEDIIIFYTDQFVKLRYSKFKNKYINRNKPKFARVFFEKFMNHCKKIYSNYYTLKELL